MVHRLPTMIVVLTIAAGRAALAQEESPMTSDTPVTIERVEGPMQDLEIFGEDGPFHIWTQDVIATVRTVEGRPLYENEKQESRFFAVDCSDNGQATNVSEGETEDGAYILSYTCEYE